jgi:cell division GTPase FtsZ
MTTTSSVLSPQEKERINWLHSRVDLLIVLDTNPPPATTGHNGCLTGNEASVKRLYHHVVDQLVNALTFRTLVCFDVADLQTCLGGAKRTFAAMQTCCGATRAITATRMAISILPFRQKSIQKASGVFAIVTGGPDMSIREFN